jgi:hypothetical protein
LEKRSTLIVAAPRTARSEKEKNQTAVARKVATTKMKLKISKPQKYQLCRRKLTYRIRPQKSIARKTIH